MDHILAQREVLSGGNRSAERMLDGDVNHVTWDQFKESIYAKFFFNSLKGAKG